MQLSGAADMIAKRRGFAGPYANGHNGFSRPTLKRFWVDGRGHPVLGIWENPGRDASLTRFPDE